MYCPAFSVESVEFPYFAFKSRKKRHVSPNGVESVEIYVPIFLEKNEEEGGDSYGGKTLLNKWNAA